LGGRWRADQAGGEKKQSKGWQEKRAHQAASRQKAASRRPHPPGACATNNHAVERWRVQ